MTADNSAATPPELRVWYLTTGEAGYRTQARGLAQAVAGYRTQARGLARAVSDDAQEWVVDLRPLWRWLPGPFARFALAGLDPARERPAPPWPDLLITCGRRAALVAIAIKRASRGRTATVHVQNPLTALSAFDLIVAMDHDRMSGPNVISMATSMHDVTPARLAAAAEVWRDRLAPDARPLIGVLLGGSTRRQPFDQGQAAVLLERLARLQASVGARLAVTPSRRTPEAVRSLFAERLAGDPLAFFWDGTGDNPYLGMLALSQRLVVTSDSVSMVSEALATTAGVELFGADGGPRHADFVAGLIRRGLVRRFEGDPTPPPAHPPIDATGLAAQAVRRMLAARTGASG